MLTAIRFNNCLRSSFNPIYWWLPSSEGNLLNKRHLATTTIRCKGVDRKRDSSDSRSRLRNIGIIAHINAGKTTTTERILFNAGSTELVGDVDKGNTVTDYLIQERDRGITITSAAVTFDWKKHRVNLIDTPGHVDFTIEVERSLSVLDGAVTILDASAGVEAQTITVWNQATKYQLPNIIFLNKYDKPQADYRVCMKEIEYVLGIKANLIQLPIKQNSSQEKFHSLIDVINRNVINWSNPEQNNGTRFSVESISETSNIELVEKKILEQVEMEREKLVNVLCDFDEDFASHVIECDKISDVSGDLIEKALRGATIRCQMSPVLVGSSFKYIGVQQLLDCIVKYLPSPIERENQILKSLLTDADERNVKMSKENCALIFKIMHDKRLGALNYVRVCNGTITSLQKLQNFQTNKVEQVKKVYRAFADELKEIDKPITKDDIVVVTGLNETRTGDIIVDPNSRLLDTNNTSHHQSQDANTVVPPSPSSEQDPMNKLPFQLFGQHIIVPQINQMEPVYFCSIEALNSSHQLKFEQALTSMAREDPSFSFGIDSLGITTIRGMGKLHLEVARDRIESEHGIKSILGPLQISYRETIDGSATEELSISRLINSVNNTLYIKLYIRPKPSAGVWTGKKLRLDTSSESTLGHLRMDHRKAIENGLASTLMHGPIMGYPMIDCDILLLEFKANYRCGLPLISSAASQCLTSALQRCSPILLEPIMLLEVVTPSEFNGLVLSDISARRGVVLSTLARQNRSIVIRSHTPLAMLTDYSEFLRINTSGRASFSMELFNYLAMSEADKQSVARF